MGVENLWDVLTKLGVTKKRGYLGPGATILIDAMMYFYAFYDTCSQKTIGKGPGGGRHDDSMLEKLAETLVPFDHHQVFSSVVDESGSFVPNFDYFAGQVDRDRGKLNTAIRDRIEIEMIRHLSSAVAAGVCPILIWDPFVGGLPGTVGKLPRPKKPFLIGRDDIIHVYTSLKLAGIPSTVAWTEGEKVACAASQSGLGVPISKDTDCHVFGCGATAEKFWSSGRGVTLSGMTTRADIIAGFGSAGLPPESVSILMHDAALYLGNDFCPRLRLNGPAKFLTRILTIAAGLSGEYVPFLTDGSNDARAANIPNYHSMILNAHNFFIITEDDRQRAATLVQRAIESAWKPNVNLLIRVGAPPQFAEFLEVLERGVKIDGLANVPTESGLAGGIAQDTNLPEYDQTGAVGYD